MAKMELESEFTEQPVDYNKELQGDLKITSDLSLEFEKHASLYARWGFLKARAAHAVRLLEEEEALVFAELYAAYKKDNPDAKENELKSHVKMHPRFQFAQDCHQKAQFFADIFKNAVAAFEQRGYMLKELGELKKQEWYARIKGGPFLDSDLGLEGPSFQEEIPPPTPKEIPRTPKMATSSMVDPDVLPQRTPKRPRSLEDSVFSDDPEPTLGMSASQKAALALRGKQNK